MREFSVIGEAQTIVGTASLVFVNPKAAPNVNIEFLRWWLSQSANATSAQARVEIYSLATQFPQVQTPVTPAVLKRQDPNASVIVGSATGIAGTAGVNNTGAEGGFAGRSAIYGDNWNALNGFLLIPSAAETIIAPASTLSGIGMSTVTAPANLASYAMGCHFREV
jgi:hypothetical protein